MAIRINCPSCNAPNTLDEDKRGRKIRCGKCNEPIPVPAAKKKIEEAVPSSPKVKVKPTKKRSDDEDDRPVKKANPPSGKGGLLLLVGGIAAVLLLCLAGVGGIGAFFVLGSKPADQVIAKAEDKPADAIKKEVNDDGNRVPNPDVVVKPKDEKPEEVKPKDENPKEEKPNPNAGKTLPPQLSPELLDKVEKATVYLHVTMPSGVTAEGSGFFAVERGIIITNAHVLGMLLESSKAPKEVAVVQNSGLSNESKMVGQVLGVDRVSDLAVIRVPDNPNLPTPLNLATDAPKRTQKTYILGFPFGERLGKNLTITQKDITSLRLDKSGGLDQIQIDGGMNPGNSGGPVVNTQGDLIGVSVSIISGAQISFAVPAEKVRRVMEGRVTDHQHGEAFTQQGKAHLPVRLTCLDPLNKIRDLRLEVWTAPPGQPRPRSSQKPQPLPGDGPHQEHVVTYANGVGTLDVPLPPLPGGHVYWVQPVLTSGAGKHWGAAQPTDLDFAVLERKPVELTVNLEKQKERTTKLESRLTFIETIGKTEDKEVVRVTAETLEVLQEPAMQNGRRTAMIRTAYFYSCTFALVMEVRFSCNECCRLPQFLCWPAQEVPSSIRRTPP